MDLRRVEDRLREEYFDLLPQIRQAADELDATVKHALLPVVRKLEAYERLEVTSRVKECESAIQKLMPQSGEFDPTTPGAYSLTKLKDLAAVRVKVFPRSRLKSVHRVLRQGVLKTWRADPFKEGQNLGFKYFGRCRKSDAIQSECQMVPMLVGLFWEVEHAVIYKPSLGLASAAAALRRRDEPNNVLRSLEAFEDAFAQLLRTQAKSIKSK